MTRAATVEGWRGREALSIAIERLPGGGWKLNGVMQPAVNGCIDVDLARGSERFLAPSSRMIVIDDAGHFLHLEDPAQVNDHILSWVS